VAVGYRSFEKGIVEGMQEMKNRWGCATAGEAQHIPQQALVACFGDRLGTYVWKAVRGLKAEKGQTSL
jgi:hypothetical protein